MKRIGAVVACALLFPAAAWAFKLKPIGGDESIAPIANRQALGFLQLFTSDVHERITRRTYEEAGIALPPDVMIGVRWNDNPPAIRLGPLFGSCHARDLKPDEQVDCWTSILRVDRMALETLSRREKTIAPLRSHFGDMQFLHAMAPHGGESAVETRAKILHWAEFAYRVARGEIGARVNLHGLGAKPLTLEAGTARFVSDLFRAPEKRLWSVQDLLVSGQGNLQSIAFGTFLHLVQDSYSASHVLRTAIGVQANGCPSYDGTDAILEFHTYAEQDTEKHALCDDPPDWLESPRAGSPIDTMTLLVRAYHEGRDWAAVKPILEEQVFRLSPTTRAARAGACFVRTEAFGTEGARPAPTALEPSCGEGDKP